MSQPVVPSFRQRDPAWVSEVIQPGPNGRRFDSAGYFRSTVLPAGFVVMYDATDVGLLPPGAEAYAGYEDGQFANMSQLAARFPSAALVSVTWDGGSRAMYIDIEPGNVTADKVPGFIKAGGIGFYASPAAATGYSAQECIDACTAAGIPRSQYLYWSAHWIGPHICGPNVCGYPQADGTQYLSTPGWDESVVIAPGFFSKPAPPVPPRPPSVPVWQKVIYSKLPTLRVGAVDVVVRPPWVHQVQELVSAVGPVPCSADGAFGPLTLAAVQAAQTSFGLTADGVVGPLTWAALAAGGVSSILPVISQGSTDVLMVKRVQALCTVAGQPLAKDGVFGQETLAAVRAVQSYYLPYDQVDGVVGPVTWSLLLAHVHP